MNKILVGRTLFNLQKGSHVAAFTFNSNRMFSSEEQNKLFNPDENQRRLHQDSVNVSICGLITRDPFHNESGSITLNVTTMTPNMYRTHETHTIVVGMPSLIKLFGPVLEEGQRVYVNGKITDNKTEINGKMYTKKSHIFATGLFIVDNPLAFDTSEIDLNQVNLKGFIDDIQKVENAMFLDVLTLRKRADRETKGLYQYHSVCVETPHLLRICDQLDIGDGIFVHGSLEYRTKFVHDTKFRNMRIRGSKIILHEKKFREKK